MDLLVADDGDDSVGDEAVAAGSADEIFEGEDEEDDWEAVRPRRRGSRRSISYGVEGSFK